jgi:hypothetical protein
MGMRRTVLPNVSLILAAMLACAVALLVASTKPAEATFPGKNGAITFVRDDLENYGYPWLHRMNPDGTAVSPLSGGGGLTEDTAWSADGTKIAVSSYHDVDYYASEV